MDTINYDFESALEAGFKTLFNAAGLALRVADDADEGELPDERITLEIDAGGPISDEHQNADGIYDNYAGTIAVEVQTPRVANDQTAAATIQQVTTDDYTVSGAGTIEANGTYTITPGVGLYTKQSNGYTIIKIVSIFPSLVNWEIRNDSGDSLYATEETDPADDIQAEPSNAFITVDGNAPAPTLSKATAQTGFRSRHRELVATVRKTLEEIDATALSTHWPDALSPTKITPSGTDRENDNDSQMTTLNYAIQFRIA